MEEIEEDSCAISNQVNFAKKAGKREDNRKEPNTSKIDGEKVINRENLMNGESSKREWDKKVVGR